MGGGLGHKAGAQGGLPQPSLRARSHPPLNLFFFRGAVPRPPVHFISSPPHRPPFSMQALGLHISELDGGRRVHRVSNNEGRREGEKKGQACVPCDA